MVLATLVCLGARLALCSARESRRRQRLENAMNAPYTITVTRPRQPHEDVMHMPTVIADRASSQDDPVYVPSIETPPIPPPESDLSKVRRLKLSGTAGCTIVLYIFGLPMFIASVVLFRIADGYYDEGKFSGIYDDCAWSPYYRSAYIHNSDGGYERQYHTYWNDNGYKQPVYCDEGEEQWDKWLDTKTQCKIWAIILVALSGIVLILAITLSIRLCIRRQKKKRMRNQECPAAVTTTPVSPEGRWVPDTARDNQQPSLNAQPPSYQTWYRNAYPQAGACAVDSTQGNQQPAPYAQQAFNQAWQPTQTFAQP